MRLNSRAILLILALYLLSGAYVVRANEQAVVRRFGRVIAERVPPGPHYHLPFPIDRVDRLKVREQKVISVGFDLPDSLLGRRPARVQTEFLTGDQNLVNIELLVQYVIRDPVAYLFAAREATAVIQLAAESALAETVAQRDVDSLLTTGKIEVQGRLRQEAQRIVDSYGGARSGVGVDITAINISRIAPPAEVQEAFRKVADAREDRSRLVNQAEGYANDLLPKARGEAAKNLEDAAGYRERKILEARGDAERFVRAYEAYRGSKDVTSARLYLEAMEEILPKLKTVFVDHNGGSSPIDLSIIQRAETTPSSAPAAGSTPDNSTPGSGPAGSGSVAPPTGEAQR
jgi:modulator of FtsH protease HflK